MADEKILTNEELTDEQLNETSGGVQALGLLQKCFLCSRQKRKDELVFVKINGVTRKVCTGCAPKTVKTANI